MYKYPLGTLVKTSHQLGMIVSYDQNHNYVVEWYFGPTYQFSYSEEMIESFISGITRLRERNFENPHDW